LATAAGHHRDPLPLLRAAPPHFVLTLWTDDPALAARADAAGIDRIGIDIERIGKAERQRGLGTWISPHGIGSLPALRGALGHARLFARTNPVNGGTRDEVQALLDAGVEVLMLPMFSTAGEVERFAEIVDGRAQIVLLLEQVQAALAIGAILEVETVSEVHVGINDFALDLGLPNRFLALTHPLTEQVAHTVREAGRRFGIGGIGRAGDSGLPIGSELIYAQYARLEATAALVARAFLGADGGAVDLGAEVARARACLADWYQRDDEELHRARAALTRAARRSGRW
jgi:hypothetical protein